MFCAHVAAYKVVFRRWAAGDFSTYVAVVDYPSLALADYLETSFRYLKGEQAKLVGRRRGA